MVRGLVLYSGKKVGELNSEFNAVCPTQFAAHRSRIP